MSSKNKKLMVVAHNEGQVAEPRLRFPEFSVATGWRRMALKPYLIDQRTRVAADTDLPVYSSTRSGLKLQSSYFDGTNLSNDGEYNVVPEGSFTFRHMSDDSTFKFNVNDTGGKIAVSKEYPVFKAKNISPLFLKYILNESHDFSRFAQMQKKGGTRTRLYFSTLCEWDPFLPSRDEQDKVAACLLSADRLIDAVEAKLEALQSYKKGLLQQLFPQPGDTFPQVRFPDFANGKPWENQAIGQVCEILNKRRKPIAAAERKRGPFPYYGASGIIDYVEDYIFDERLVLVGEDGARWGEFEPTAFIVSGRYWVKNHAHILRPRKVHESFLESYLFRLDMRPFVGGQAPPKLTLATLKELQIPVPQCAQEQSMIGNCFASINLMISEVAESLVALRVHKAGLLQKLFPVADEVRG